MHAHEVQLQFCNWVETLALFLIDKRQVITIERVDFFFGGIGVCLNSYFVLETLKS